MANNIRIIGNILNTFISPRYKTEDTNLISSRTLSQYFGGEGDYIEFHLKDVTGNVLNIEYNYLKYKLPSSSFLAPETNNPNTTGNIQTSDVGIVSTLSTPTSSLYPIIEIDPIQDIKNLGYSSGEFTSKYNLFTNIMSDYINQALFIKEISRDRTEVRLASNTVPNETIEEITLSLIDEINNSDYFVDFLLNFGEDKCIVAVNIALEKNPEGYEVLFKLYEPLPLDIQEKRTLWVVKEKSTNYNFNINLDKIVTPPPPPTLRGPNFNIPAKENQGTISTSYQTYSSLITNLQSLQNSSYQQIQSLLETQSIDINIDYSNFDNFVFFGSAYQRVNNFYNKVKQIEDYNNIINYYTPYVSTTSSLQTTINQLSSSINNIIIKFDGFEYYLYFTSSSLTSSVQYSITPYPKSGSLLPYTLYSTSSVSASTWYDYATNSALDYDANNHDNLEFAVPSFLRDDQNNQPFLLFLNMVGHYFDNIWIYLKAVTDINLANNNLDYGISRDLVYQQLKSLGIKLYNSQAGDSVDSYLIGANTGSAIWDNDFTITGSYLNNIPRKDLVAELYKRIYHNLPLLVKTKGTVAGLNNLMSVFGIPNRTYYTIYSGSNDETFYTPTGSAITGSILNVKEFGGSLKSNLVDGYNNDKVRIVQNTITGSVLSPHLPLQTFPTASAAFRDDDLHYVDISFSPQTQIDTYVSGAIASNNPTWSLDDYIGDPGQSYSGSYPDLDAQRKLYFEMGVSGFNPFTASLLDYNGFIRLIEFFDNSLFKMLNDFVPERTSLSTGVTINSPVLERNKVAYSKPTVTTQSVYEADYDVASISPQYGTFFSALSSSNNTEAWYTGELNGSIVDINQYFEDDSNPYDEDWNVYNAQNPPNKQINLNSFLHSDWNVLLNNVSSSVKSNIRKHIEYVWGTTGIITSSAELQDSYLTLQSYNTSRYEGSKTTSLLYTTYTSASSTYNGDKSYGKTAAIDKIKLKYAYLVDIYTASAFLPNRSNAQIKYLIEDDANVLNLTKANFNLTEVQNVFKSGETCDVSLFQYDEDNNYTQLLANNPTLKIYEGGFRYLPILHNVSGSTSLTQRFTLGSPIEITVPVGNGALLLDDFTPNPNIEFDDLGGGFGNYYFKVSVTADPAVTARTFVTFDWVITLGAATIASGISTVTIQAPPGITSNETTVYSIVGEDLPSGEPYILSVEITGLSGGPSSTGSFSTFYTTQVTSSSPCILYNTSSGQLVFNSTIAQYYNTLGITFNSTSDTNWSTSGLERVILPFTIQKGDRISIFDSASSLGWDERFEFTINSVSTTGSGTGSRLLVDTYPPINTSNLSPTSSDSVTGANYRLCRYIVWKHVPDETNVVLRYNPVDPTITEKGLLFPQYINDNVKKNAGNTIQTLTANNLISE